VLFDEHLWVHVEQTCKRALRDCDLFVAIGTSGTVSPASNFVRSARYAGARTILVNLEPMSPPNPEFREELLGRAEELLPRLIPA
jgi:NAD-dependent deacetylase